MNRINIIKTLLLLIGISITSALAGNVTDVYLIIYATYGGYSGHAAIAVDNYRIEVRDTIVDNKTYAVYDTIATGYLTIYALYPKGVEVNSSNFNRDIEPLYYKGPEAFLEDNIKPFDILTDGTPMKKGVPCDGLVRLKTSPDLDFALVAFLDHLIEKRHPFNALKYNCSDYVRLALEYLADEAIVDREAVFIHRITTPNALYKAAAQLPSAVIVKDAGHKIEGTFLKDYILKTRLRSFNIEK